MNKTPKHLDLPNNVFTSLKIDCTLFTETEMK